MSHGRLTTAFIESVKERVVLAELIGEDVALRRSGLTSYGRCPFHDDRTPSFAVNSVHNTYLCRGCGANGDVYKWLKKRRGMEFMDAMQFLCDRLGISLPAMSPATTAEASDARERAILSETLRQAQSLYRYGLSRSARARDYLLERGIDDATIQQFGIGHVGPGIHRTLSSRVRNPTSISDAGIVRLKGAGVIELMRDRIVWPLHSDRGGLIGFAGRTFSGQASSAPKYINTPDTKLFAKHRELYGLNHARAEIARRRSAVVVEGYFDVWSLHQKGEKRAVAVMGTRLTSDHAKRLFRDADEVVLWMDGDLAGRRAISAAAISLLGALKDGQSVRVVALSSDDDPDGIAQRGGSVAIADALDSATPLSDYLIKWVAPDADLHVPEKVAAMAVEAHGWLNACAPTAPFYREALGQAFTRRLGITLQSSSSE